MLLKKDVEVIVFSISNDKIEEIGQLNEYSSLMWTQGYYGYYSFELWAPITEENLSLLNTGNLLWCGEENAAIVESIELKVEDDGHKSLTVKGRTLEMLLTTRVINGTFSVQDKNVSTAMIELVNQNCVSPDDSKRKIPFFEIDDDPNIEKKISYQKTGGEIYEALSEIAYNNDVGFKVVFDARNKKFKFKVYQGENKTLTVKGVTSVILSSDMEDILSSSYYYNNQSKKDVAYVYGEVKEGEPRVSVLSGNENSSGFGRREVYVDASSLQSSFMDDAGQTINLSAEEYKTLLIEQGNGVLSELNPTEDYEAKMRILDASQFVYGVDYNIGDIVTIMDKQLGVYVDARVIEVEQDWDDEYKVYLTFGFSSPSLIKKMQALIYKKI